MRKRIAIAVLMLSASLASAQSMEAQVQGLINAEGESCERVTRSKGLGRDENGNVYVAVACSNGEKHVIKVGDDNSLEYKSSCWAWRASIGSECF